MGSMASMPAAELQSGRVAFIFWWVLEEGGREGMVYEGEKKGKSELGVYHVSTSVTTVEKITNDKLNY